MQYFYRENVDRGKRYTIWMIGLFCLLYVGTLIFDIFQNTELTVLYVIRTVFGFGILYYFYRGNLKAYFFIELQLLVLLFIIIMGALGFVFYKTVDLNDSNFICYLIAGIVLTVLAAVLIFKSRFIKDVETFLQYQRGR